ncbi:hypothetical protein FJT64_021527 [Amphibalanus amphitrite]|uniref:Uncharacterized protein n=1 Tax=Amphibalanus amphitrite TaxID=1232801 RepID=A0A6A4WTB5_AMPAM|nr:hypothetical protein FJT64_000972 [Amphibalanus amphitrite]KAF0307074.1 hypothetical protein FJT64_021527 [Amphibalanus amphitrite]
MEPKVVLALVLLTISTTRAFYLDPFGFGGGFGGFGGFGGGYGGFGFGAPLVAPVPVHHHTVQPIIQPIIIQPPEEEEEPPPKVEVHVHGEPPPPEPHPPEPPPIQVIHV